MITRKQRSMVQPSSKDAISSWLDVLTSMLSLPETKRTQIRDELEDHLRSRVDDLLISGIDEHEAIQQAVTELGETAQLAKVVTNAHTHTTPRRRTMHAILITSAIAGMSIGGYSFLNTPIPSALPAAMTAGALIAENSEETAPKVHEFDIAEVPTLMAFDEVARAFGYTVDIHTLDQGIVSDLQHRPVSLFGEFTLEQAIQAIRMQSLQHASKLTTQRRDHVLELLTRDEQARRSVITRVFRLGEAGEDAIHEAGETLGDLLIASIDMKWVAVSVVGNGLIVSGPPEAIQKAEQSWAMISDLHSSAIRQRKEHADQREAEEENQRESLEARRQEWSQQSEAARQQALEKLKGEYARVRDGLIHSRSDLAKAYAQQNEIMFGGAEQEGNKGRVPEIKEQIDRLEMQIAELEVRYEYLQSKVIDTEYSELFAGL
ncbi:MAG: hypothetical protein JKY96_03065 [Phycisphaerales bacterium]|nr:hypothetical protein [Phycisphaerales bacterium]